MERINLSDLKINNSGLRTSSFIVASGTIDKGFDLKNGDFDILINDLNSNQKIIINLYEDASAKISFFVTKELKNLDVEINCHKNSSLNVYFADFSKDENLVNVNIALKEVGANAIWHLASLTSKQDKKTFNVSVKHESKNTYAKVDNYGVCKDEGKLLFAGTSHIIKGSIETKTYQNAKIMVFDKDCIATAKPVLKIDENDIEANHAAVVGKVNDEHLFYLTSRGLSENQAKEIITFGYLKPILEGFIEEEIKEEITKLIEGRM